MDSRFRGNDEPRVIHQLVPILKRQAVTLVRHSRCRGTDELEVIHQLVPILKRQASPWFVIPAQAGIHGQEPKEFPLSRE